MTWHKLLARKVTMISTSPRVRVNWMQAPALAQLKLHLYKSSSPTEHTSNLVRTGGKNQDFFYFKKRDQRGRDPSTYVYRRARKAPGFTSTVNAKDRELPTNM